MDDLVERLRTPRSRNQFATQADLYNFLCDEREEAANEIESLRAQLSAQSVSAVQPVAWMWEYHGKRVTPDKAEADAIAADVPVTALVPQRAADADAVDAKWLADNALRDAKKIINELCDGYCVPKPLATIERIDAAIAAQSTERAKG